MKYKFTTLIILACCSFATAQVEISTWTLNAGQYASYWENTNGSPTSPAFVFYTTTTLADITKVCYNTNYVWVQCEGMTTEMGKFLNPGAPSAQNYSFVFPRTPTVATTKTTSPKGGAIGLLKNGIPIYGLGNSHYYNGSSNNGNGSGTWNVEVYKAEKVALDATLGAHPQQEGAYHSHAKPYRLYSSTAATVHSPIVGWAFDGYPVYGPYGYTSPLDATTTITRMKSGYSLRNITQRTSLPYNVSLTSANYGPAVSTTYPIGTYCEDYEWLASNNGDLDKYNGRFCVTPEYPLGTYAYFVTIDATETPQFPYYIGIQYYGVPSSQTAVSIPTTADISCNLALAINDYSIENAQVYPNPSSGNFTINLPDLNGESLIEIYTLDGKLIYSTTSTTIETTVRIQDQSESLLLLKVTNNGNQFVTKMIMK